MGSFHPVLCLYLSVNHEPISGLTDRCPDPQFCLQISPATTQLRVRTKPPRSVPSRSSPRCPSSDSHRYKTNKSKWWRAPSLITSCTAWLAIQTRCADLWCTCAHLQQGTLPSKKLTNIRDVKSYLHAATIAKYGLLVMNQVWLAAPHPQPQVHYRPSTGTRRASNSFTHPSQKNHWWHQSSRGQTSPY